MLAVVSPRAASASRNPCHTIMQRRGSLFLRLTVLCACIAVARPYAIDTSESWSLLTRGSTDPRCIDIPANFTLCRNLEYGRMRLPNLLDHETVAEAMSQAQSWLPLLRLNCNSDAQLFLCSLFAPVCLERVDKPIQPCRSLCEHVRNGCEARMQFYNFPWPEMLRCDKFPPQHDMCIQPRDVYENQTCSACKQVETFENLLDNFCRSTHVLKVRVQNVQPTFVKVKQGRAIKPSMNKRDIKGMRLMFGRDQKQCPCEVADEGSRRQRFLVMGNLENGQFLMNLIRPWHKDRHFKRAVRAFRKLDCSSVGQELRNRSRRGNLLQYQRQQFRRLL